MNRPASKAFTLIELLVVIAVIAVLMSILMPALNRAREQGKRAMCQGNLKSLQLAWAMYADDNSGKIVSGDAGNFDKGNSAWVGKCWTSGWADGNRLTEEEQLAEIKRGYLYKYMGKNDKAYRCPTGIRGDIVSYSIMDTMNGRDRKGAIPKSANGVKVVIKNLNDIKHAANRMVFIDEGRVPWDSFAVRCKPLRWWDAPQARHGFGTNFSFADGHVEYWKWTNKKTIEAGELFLNNKWVTGGDQSGQYSENNEDLERVGRSYFGTVIK